MDVPDVGSSIPIRGGRVSRAFGRTLMRLIGWRFEGDLPDLPKLIVIGAPHSSNHDFVVAMAAMFALGIDLRIMGKHTLFKWPLGGFMRFCGLIPIDRRAAHGVVGETVRIFGAADRLWIGIAPEGTRSNAGAVWKSGFWQIARRGNVPVMPLALDYAMRAVRFGTPFTPTDDIHADMQTLSVFYGGVRGARRTIPERICVRAPERMGD